MKSMRRGLTALIAEIARDSRRVNDTPKAPQLLGEKEWAAIARRRFG